MYYNASKLNQKFYSFVILPRGYGRLMFDNSQERLYTVMDNREMLNYLNKIDMSLIAINTLINKKWYDEQSDIIKLVADARDSCNILQSTIKTEITKEKMVNVLCKYCDINHGCLDCILYNEGNECAVGTPYKLRELKFKEICDKYGQVEEWAKSFLID